MAFTIGKLATDTGISKETIRYYHRIGLLPQPERNESGYFQYSHKHVEMLHFIKNTQNLGFTLKEIHWLMNLKHDPNASAKDVKQKTLEKIKEIENKVRTLVSIRKELEAVVGECDGACPLSECPILKKFDQS
jgi:Cu(I)-responsive transcriptional regulator